MEWIWLKGWLLLTTFECEQKVTKVLIKDWEKVTTDAISNRNKAFIFYT